LFVARDLSETPTAIGCAGQSRGSSPPPSPTISNASSHTSVQQTPRREEAQPSRSNLGMPAGQHTTGHPTEIERLSPLGSSHQSSKKPQPMAQNISKAVAAPAPQIDPTLRSLPLLPRLSTSVSRGPLANGYRASRYQPPAIQRDTVTSANILRDVQEVHNVSSPPSPPAPAPSHEAHQLRTHLLPVASRPQELDRRSAVTLLQRSETPVLATRTIVGLPLSPVQSENEGEGTQSSGSTPCSEVGSARGSRPGQDKETGSRHQGVFVSQFLNEPSPQTSPTRKATWCGCFYSTRLFGK
jgi:hypothetical protein